jgi:uncharacterized coiled-coil protein SlyX
VQPFRQKVSNSPFAPSAYDDEQEIRALNLAVTEVSREIELQKITKPAIKELNSKIVNLQMELMDTQAKSLDLSKALGW